MRVLKLSSLLALLLWQPWALADVNHYFESIKGDPNALYAFLKAMPKGGELHYHLAGGSYPETMLKLAAQANYCLDKQTLSISKTTKECDSKAVKVSELTTKYPLLYDQAIRAWSMKDFIAGQESNHDHFFATFYKFMPLVVDHRPQLLAEVMQRAANQHELYLEVMVLADNAQSTTFAQSKIKPEEFASVQQKLLADKRFQDNIQKTADEVSRILKNAREDLGCTKNPGQEVCKLTVKFQYYVLREQPLEKVFTQAVNGFAAVSRSKDLVAVNLVQAEDGIISLRDYSKQMNVFNFLHKAYPQVHISLHAGELAPNTVMPEELGFHIREAIEIAHAERIGHGVDIGFEDQSEQILQEMAEKSIPVEINLISNKAILNISGSKHPLNDYLKHKVPVVLSTDDEGVLRTDLTQQYVEAASVHGLDYPSLKRINRNALTYSFLPGKSLWENTEKALPVKACQDFNSPSCLKFAETSEKAKLQLQLENKLAAFEKGYEGGDL